MFQLRVFALAVTCLFFIGARAQADGPAVPAATGWNMVSQTITDRTVLVDGDTTIVFGTANVRTWTPPTLPGFQFLMTRR